MDKDELRKNKKNKTYDSAPSYDISASTRQEG